MLDSEISQRIKITDILKHPWFNKNLRKPTKRVRKTILKSIKQFHAPNKFYQEAMKLLVRNLTEEEIFDLKEAFMQIDRNHTG